MVREWMEVCKSPTMSVAELRALNETSYAIIETACSALPLDELEMEPQEKVESIMRLIASGFLRMRFRLAGDGMAIQWRFFGQPEGWNYASVKYREH